MPKLAKPYNLHAVELRHYGAVDPAAFRLSDDALAEADTVVAEPTEVCDSMTIAGVLNAVRQDVLLRDARRRGRSAAGIVCWDDATFPAHDIVADLFRREGETQVDRERFVERCEGVVVERIRALRRQLRRLGCFFDDEREQSTMRDEFRVAVRHAFSKLHEEGVVYRRESVVNWCVTCGAARSDDEVLVERATRRLYHLRYSLSGGTPEEDVVVVTARPETIFGDQALAVHPDDDRHRSLIGRRVWVPIAERDIPIVADEEVDPDFGTGVIRVTPGHGVLDYRIGRRHDLATLRITDGGERLSAASGPLAGMDRAEAQAEVIRRFEDMGRVAKRESVSVEEVRCRRDSTVTEPRVTTQWFVRLGELAPSVLDVLVADADAVEAAEPGTLIAAIRDTKDWCISRQRWWGHRIPVWYCLACDESHEGGRPLRCATCGHEAFRQDEDVFDSRFASWLWPLVAFGWPSSRHRSLSRHPSVYVGGIRLARAARTTMAVVHFTGRPPRRQCLAARSRPTGKATGKRTEVDASTLVDRYGADATRLAIVTTSEVTASGDVWLTESQAADGLAFVERLWQRGRDVASLEPDEAASRPDPLAERWIHSRIVHLYESVTEAFDAFDLGAVVTCVRTFLAEDFAPYLELRAAREGSCLHVETARVGFRVLLDGLHPVMPFITAELSQGLPPVERIPRSWQRDPAAEAAVRLARTIAARVRRARRRMNVSGSRSSLVLLSAETDRHAALTRLTSLIGAWCHSDVRIVEAVHEPDLIHLEEIEGVAIHLDVTGLVDPEAERRRILKELGRTSKLYHASYNRLNNPAFVHQAPESVVRRERARLQRLDLDRARLNESLAILSSGSKEQEA